MCTVSTGTAENSYHAASPDIWVTDNKTNLLIERIKSGGQDSCQLWSSVEVPVTTQLLGDGVLLRAYGLFESHDCVVRHASVALAISEDQELS